MYNGHERTHAIKFQSVVAPDGLIVHLYGPVEGKRRDSALLNESNLLQELVQYANGPHGPVQLYGDLGYPITRHMKPYAGVITPDQQVFNVCMSLVRQCVEWQFGWVITLWTFMDFKKNLKLYLQPVGRLYRLAVLLTNCHVCLREQNQTSKFFGIQPSSIWEYLQ